MIRAVGILLLCAFGFLANAQQRIESNGMTYFSNPKPNTILYRDTIFSGKKQFQQLFYRTGNQQLIYLLEKHQANKITGQVLALAGTVATIMGISRINAAQNEKGLAWILIGGGFVTSMTGGYFALLGQRNLQLAVTLFNQQYHRSALGIGIAEKRAGLVYTF